MLKNIGIDITSLNQGYWGKILFKGLIKGYTQKSNFNYQIYLTEEYLKNLKGLKYYF